MRSSILLVIAAVTCLSGQEQSKPKKAPKADVGAGRVAWFDVTTTDLKKSKEFYGKLFDWKYTQVQGTNLAAEIVAGGTAIGTIRVAEGQIGAFNGVVYVQVDDAVAASKKATELGATVPPGFPFDLTDGGGAVGLFTDPCGHPMGIYSRTPIAAAKSSSK